MEQLHVMVPLSHLSNLCAWGCRLSKLTDLPSIGEKRAALLRSHGCRSVSEVARLSPSKLKDIFGNQLSDTEVEAVLHTSRRLRRRRLSFSAFISAAIVIVGLLANIDSIAPSFSKLYEKEFRSGASLYVIDHECGDIESCKIAASVSDEPVIADIHFFTSSPYSDRALPICLALRFGVAFDHKTTFSRKLLVSVEYGSSQVTQQRYLNSGYPRYDGDFETCSVHEPFYFPDHPNYSVERLLHRSETATTAEYSFTEYVAGDVIHFNIPVRLDPNSFLVSDSTGDNPYIEEFSADLNLEAIGPRAKFHSSPISVRFQFQGPDAADSLTLNLFNHVVHTPDEIGLRSSLLSNLRGEGETARTLGTFIGDIGAVSVDQSYIDSFRSGGVESAVVEAQRGYFRIDETSLRRALAQRDTAHLYGAALLLRRPELSAFEQSCVDELLVDAEHLGPTVILPTEKFNHAHNSFRTFGIFERQMPHLIDAMNAKDCFEDAAPQRP